MPFLPNIPQPTDQLSVSQANILNNFQILGAIAGNANPASASINLNSGFNFVYLPNQSAAPTIPVNEVALYSQLNVPTNEFELFINHSVNSGVVQTPATASVLGNATPGNISNGWTYLPSGIILKWFHVTSGGATTTVVLNSQGPNFAACFHALVTGDTEVGVLRVTALTAANATVSGTVLGRSFYIFAIGR